MTENQLGELLERATADLRSTTDLVAGGVSVGRRRRRRGLAAAAAGTFVAAGVAGAALFVLPGGQGGNSTVVADETGPGTAAGSVATSPSVSTQAPAVPAYDGPFPLAPDTMVSTLATLLHGTVTDPRDDQSHPATPDGWQNGAVDLDGASVTVSYQHSTGPRCDGDQGLSSCTALGDGWLGTYTARILQYHEGYTGARGVGVTFYTPDGYKISVTAMNSGVADPKKPVMDQPVLTTDQLTTIAQDPVWRS